MKEAYLFIMSHLGELSQTYYDWRVVRNERHEASACGDYARIDALIEEVRAHNAEARRAGGIVIACGMSRFDGDDCVASVFERADHRMYENKSALKSLKAALQAHGEGIG